MSNNEEVNSDAANSDKLSGDEKSDLELSTSDSDCGHADSMPNSTICFNELSRQLVDYNAYLSCFLCKGYLIDAATLVECLCIFCKTCILKYVDDEDNLKSHLCPKCGLQIHKTKPKVNIRSDPTFQDIVYKLVPGLFKNEMCRRKKFYTKCPLKVNGLSNELKGDPGERTILAPDDDIQITIEYFPEITNPYKMLPFNTDDEQDVNVENISQRRYLLCKAGMKVIHLKKFIRYKYELKSSLVEVDFFYKHELLHDDFSIIDLTYIYSLRKNIPIPLYYLIIEPNTNKEDLWLFLQNNNLTMPISCVNRSVSKKHFSPLSSTNNLVTKKRPNLLNGSLERRQHSNGSDTSNKSSFKKSLSTSNDQHASSNSNKKLKVHDLNNSINNNNKSHANTTMNKEKNASEGNGSNQTPNGTTNKNDLNRVPGSTNLLFEPQLLSVQPIKTHVISQNEKLLMIESNSQNSNNTAQANGNDQNDCSRNATSEYQSSNKNTSTSAKCDNHVSKNADVYEFVDDSKSTDTVQQDSWLPVKSSIPNGILAKQTECKSTNEVIRSNLKNGNESNGSMESTAVNGNSEHIDNVNLENTSAKSDNSTKKTTPTSTTSSILPYVNSPFHKLSCSHSSNSQSPLNMNHSITTLNSK